MYRVLARKWRPQRFDEVIGQHAVTRTLQNAIASGRVAQAFVFAGSRGCGKTTTARILARALNCDQGPTPNPCGQCHPCIEIAQGRDLDVLEIDAASHTQVDNIRDVILSGLSVAPARDRYKIFIIDEVHQLSSHSFNALLKSVEEPPSHVIFMMATTELHKIPDTILSRSQVFEFRQIPTSAIAAQLRTIAAAEGIEVSDAALGLIARAAEGSMRDAQSAFDQVIAFAGTTISDEDVSTVLGLVGRDLLFEIVDAVVDEDAPRAFALADRAVEAGHDLRLVCRELTALVRDLMMVSVDPTRAADGEVAAGERERLAQQASRFSREDLMRAFDVLAKAEQDIRAASQPRYHFEMALLRWMHLRKLVPLMELLERLGPGGGQPTPSGGALPRASGAARPSPAQPAPSRATAAPASRPAPRSSATPATNRVHAPQSSPAAAVSVPAPGSPGSSGLTGAALKDALLAEIRTGKGTLYSLAVAMASRIDVDDQRIAFTFAANQKVARSQLEQQREWIESLAQRLSGRRIPVVALLGDSTAPAAGGPAAAASVSTPTASDPSKTGGAPGHGDRDDVRAEALASPAVQALLEVFPAEIRDVEEM
jgi:DNA polymerase-3 subunit gamma/tau